MYRTRLILAIMLIAAGAVWIGQGLGWIRSSSFMTDDVRWAWIGLGTLIAGVVVGIVAVRGRRRAA
jgi:hypothetical protein